ncbi:hypothetical protein CDD80_2084 [Ophiocordyceps camponoti-rufipedis]|uniref:Uncharacterized protein n=1 Tax=Ophiocordyceps camponoti-rufipedis TaxID=2004952 RepID=A0A2C5Z6X4_9HYPO|nr:hypothetical protein CDD80_2084 [Ophiocordyceps camponoti-rufipedis]
MADLDGQPPASDVDGSVGSVKASTQATSKAAAATDGVGAADSNPTSSVRPGFDASSSADLQKPASASTVDGTLQSVGKGTPAVSEASAAATANDAEGSDDSGSPSRYGSKSSSGKFAESDEQAQNSTNNSLEGGGTETSATLESGDGAQGVNLTASSSSETGIGSGIAGLDRHPSASTVDGGAGVGSVGSPAASESGVARSGFESDKATRPTERASASTVDGHDESGRKASAVTAIPSDETPGGGKATVGTGKAPESGGASRSGASRSSDVSGIKTSVTADSPPASSYPLGSEASASLKNVPSVNEQTARESSSGALQSAASGSETKSNEPQDLGTMGLTQTETDVVASNTISSDTSRSQQLAEASGMTRQPGKSSEGLKTSGNMASLTHAEDGTRSQVTVAPDSKSSSGYHASHLSSGQLQEMSASAPKSSSPALGSDSPMVTSLKTETASSNDEEGYILHLDSTTGPPLQIENSTLEGGVRLSEVDGKGQLLPGVSSGTAEQTPSSALGADVSRVSSEYLASGGAREEVGGEPRGSPVAGSMHSSTPGVSRSAVQTPSTALHPQHPGISSLGSALTPEATGEAGTHGESRGQPVHGSTWTASNVNSAAAAPSETAGAATGSQAVVKSGELPIASSRPGSTSPTVLYAATRTQFTDLDRLPSGASFKTQAESGVPGRQQVDGESQGLPVGSFTSASSLPSVPNAAATSQSTDLDHTPSELSSSEKESGSEVSGKQHVGGGSQDLPVGSFTSGSTFGFEPPAASNVAAGSQSTDFGSAASEMSSLETESGSGAPGKQQVDGHAHGLPVVPSATGSAGTRSRFTVPGPESTGLVSSTPEPLVKPQVDGEYQGSSVAASESSLLSGSNAAESMEQPRFTPHWELVDASLACLRLRLPLALAFQRQRASPAKQLDPLLPTPVLRLTSLLILTRLQSRKSHLQLMGLKTMPGQESTGSSTARELHPLLGPRFLQSQDSSGKLLQRLGTQLFTPRLRPSSYFPRGHLPEIRKKLTLPKDARARLMTGFRVLMASQWLMGNFKARPSPLL